MSHVLLVLFVLCDFLMCPIVPLPFPTMPSLLFLRDSTALVYYMSLSRWGCWSLVNPHVILVLPPHPCMTNP